MIAKPTWDSFVSLCRGSTKTAAANAKKCEALTIEMFQQIGNLNPYALDYNVCIEDTTSNKAGKINKGKAQRFKMMHSLMAAQSEKLRVMMGVNATEPVYEPCEDDYTSTYLNQANVKEAMHVNTNIIWEECSYKINYSGADGLVSMVPNYQYLIDGGYGLNILVYSGDDDSVCSTIGTQEWIWGMGYSPTKPYWNTYTVNGQTAGYLTRFGTTKLALLTVHDAGHEVPTYKPEAALTLFTDYLNGKFTE